MPDIGFGRDEGHGDFVAKFAAAKLGVEYHRKFVSRTETRGALHRADHDRAGVLAEFLERDFGCFGVVDVANGLGRALRPETFNFIKGQIWSGCDDQIIIRD
jgi:hypothetical protein